MGTAHAWLISLPLLLQHAGAGARTPAWLSWLAERWVYTTMGATSIVTEEVAPLLGGFAAEEGHLRLWRVIVACTLGTWGAGVALYALGWWRGAWARARWHRFGDTLSRGVAFIHGRPWHTALVVRFAVGMRLILPVACGVAHLPIVPYVVGTFISAAAWSTLFTLLGWAFGETAVLVLGHVRRYEDLLAVSIVGAIVLAGVILHRKARERRAADPAGRGGAP
jgi:membrane protein DedA with SNARE-associated domain